MKRLLFILACLGLPFLASAQGSYDSALRNSTTFHDYLRAPALSSVELSPSGRWLAGVKLNAQGIFVFVSDLDNPDEQTLHLPFDESTFVNWVEWANDDWLIASVTVFGTFDGQIYTREGLNYYTFSGYETMPIPVTRLFLLRRDGTDVERVFEGVKSLEKRNLNLGRIVSFLPNDPDHFLVAATLRGDLDLFRIQVSTGDHERIGVGKTRTVGWFADIEGEPAFRVDVNSRGTRYTYYGRQDRPNGRTSWKRLKSVRADERAEAIKQSTEFRPLSPGMVTGTYYVAARPAGEPTTGIHLYDFTTDSFIRPIRVDPDRDIEDALINPESYEYLGSRYYDDLLKTEFTDQTMQAHMNGLVTMFEDKVNIDWTDSSRDGNRWLLYASGPQEPGTYYIYDVEKARIRNYGSAFPNLSPYRLAPTEIVTYEARDGLPITGYLTVPKGVKDDVIPPLVMMPHGGPEMRDTIDFDPLAQILAGNGYAVFQPNFRGSSGYGLGFADAGRRQWGKAMQHDLEDGFAHLVSAGKADASNACILGYSYGGYAALAAATLTPDLYKCVIAASGPTDLLEMLKWVRDEDGSRSDEYEYWTRHIGDPRRDRDELASVSPARMAENVKAPVLMIHGHEDAVVPIEQSSLMVEALSEAGKSVEFVELFRSGHSHRMAGDRRKEMEAIIGFLDSHLSVDPRIWSFAED
ncbi:alpha/beta hydrolase family protein [Henriciella marina]|uniref:alpha/beta hydrolase family protein n=1 Tax=Henriciella marina TaxID=453851 RepID=UPI0012EA5605|nr:prolyl oligopeptidase family serine peptidase [Henriciella marina]